MGQADWTTRYGKQNYADTHLVSIPFITGRYEHSTIPRQHVYHSTYRLHAIILSRSPYLVHLMSTSPQTGGVRTIYVQVEQEPEITQEVRLPISAYSSLLKPAIIIISRVLPLVSAWAASGSFWPLIIARTYSTWVSLLANLSE